MDDQILDPEIKAELPQEPLSGISKPWYKNGKILWSALVALLLIVGITWYFIWGQTPEVTPQSNNVVLLIKGPETMASGSEAEFHIIYRNGENADMTNVHLDLIYPSNFQFKSSTPAAKIASGQSYDLPLVKEGKDAELVIRGKMSGSTGEVKPLSAKLSYKLSNFNSTFQVTQNYQVTILAPNLTFDVTGPVEVPIGQDITFALNYANVSSQDYDNVALSLSYPEGFKFTSASVPPSKNNNLWQIGKIAAGGNGRIDVTGSFVGNNSDEQLLSGQLGQMISGTFAPQITSTTTFKLKNAPIAITQEISPDDVVTLGNSLSVTIHYQNESNVGATNLVITDTINSNLVDLPKLLVPDAVIVGSTITWRAATNSNLNILSPGQQGQVQFSIPLKSSLPSTVKNQIIQNIVTVTSAEVTSPIRAEDVNVKLAGKFNTDMSSDYVSGASPMQVGQPTTFAITWLASSESTDLAETIVTADLNLPPSSWNNVIIPDSEKSRLKFDPNSGKISWNIGDMPAFTGRLTPAAKVTFQLEVTPSASDTGQNMKLLSNIKATAKDAFTDQDLQAQVNNQLMVSDIEDPQFQQNGTTVQ